MCIYTQIKMEIYLRCVGCCLNKCILFSDYVFVMSSQSSQPRLSNLNVEHLLKTGGIEWVFNKALMGKLNSGLHHGKRKIECFCHLNHTGSKIQDIWTSAASNLMF